MNPALFGVFKLFFSVILIFSVSCDRAKSQNTVAKFAICFLPLFVTAGLQPSCCWLFVLLLLGKSITRVGNISAGNSNSFDAWWIGKVV
jgi:hypothetical protein